MLPHREIFIRLPQEMKVSFGASIVIWIHLS